MSKLIGLICLLIIKNTQVVSLSLCNVSDYLDVKEGQNNTFACRELTAQQSASWLWGSTLITTCNVSSCVQDVHQSHFSASRAETTYSNFTVYASAFSNLEYLATTNLSCQTNDSKTTCQLDVIYPAESPTCQIQFSGDTWEITGQCNVSKAGSRRDRYGCYLYQTSKYVALCVNKCSLKDNCLSGSCKKSTPYRVSVKSYGPVDCTNNPPLVDNFTMSRMPITGTNYSSGVCRIKRVLPPEGAYNYSIIIIPGEVQVLPSFNGRNEIRRPSTSPQHNCSQNIAEGNNINCLCYSDDLGLPSGSVVWKGTNSSNLRIDQVNRTYSGTSNICSLMWNNSAVQNVTYEVTVNYASRVLTFKINNKTDSFVNVSENTNVSFVCRAEGRPLPIMRIYKRNIDNNDLELVVSNNTLELQQTMTAVKCETTANFSCESDNSVSRDQTSIMLVASCSPKRVTNDSHSSTFEVEKATLTFQMIAYPLPHLLAIFYIGSENTSTSQKMEHENTTRSTCSSENMYRVSCIVTLYNETVYATGFYMATFTNLLGNLSFNFEIKEKINSTSKTTGIKTEDFVGGIIGGVVGGIVFITVSVVVIICIFRRKGRSSKQPSLTNTNMEENLSQEQTKALSSSPVTESGYQNFGLDENEEGKERKGEKEIQRRYQQGINYTTVVFHNTLSTSPAKSESSETVYSEIIPQQTH